MISQPSSTSRGFSLSQKESCSRYAVTSHGLLFLPRATSNLFSVWICLSWTFCMNGVLPFGLVHLTQHDVFRVRPVVVCISACSSAPGPIALTSASLLSSPTPPLCLPLIKKDPYHYIGPTQMIQGNLLILNVT